MPIRRPSGSLSMLQHIIGGAAMLAALAMALPAAAAETATIRLKIVGGLAAVSQFEHFEAPFWTATVPRLTEGRVSAEIAPFDRSGIRAQETLQLMRLGVVPFGTVLLSLAAADEPELNAVDLPGLNPDIAALRRTTRLWRPRLEALLRARYGVELLAIYTYPAQVIFCSRPFSGLGDLAGRRVRTSSVSQSEAITALGATPVLVPFAEAARAIRQGVAECAITGSLPGNAIGLHEVTSHLSPLAISWGVSFFGANQAAWTALPEATRDILRKGLATLQDAIWDAAERQTEDGIACNAGRPDCTGGRRGRMVVVPATEADEARRLELLREVVLPGWVERCGMECAAAWNRFMAPELGLRLPED